MSDAAASVPPQDSSAATIPAAVSDQELVASLGRLRVRMADEIAKRVVGQHAAVEHLTLAVLCRGHALLEGVPGLAKTVMVQAVGAALRLSNSRIQFTPDLMPGDITGTDIIQEDPDSGRRQYEFLPGPVFANVVLADEINRAPPKTQAALLEAMQERHVTVRGRCHELPDPFFVLATQNPIEQEGTYPLPEAQLDRFMFHIRIGYPPLNDEVEILRRTTGTADPRPLPVLDAATLRRIQDLVRQVPADDGVLTYAARLVRGTRKGCDEAIPDVVEHLQWGAGPRAAQVLIVAAKARALLAGRFCATRDDVAALAPPALRHRLVTTFAAQAAGLDVDTVIARLVARVSF